MLRVRGVFASKSVRMIASRIMGPLPRLMLTRSYVATTICWTEKDTGKVPESFYDEDIEIAKELIDIKAALKDGGLQNMITAFPAKDSNKKEETPDEIVEQYVAYSSDDEHGEHFDGSDSAEGELSSDFETEDDEETVQDRRNLRAALEEQEEEGEEEETSDAPVREPDVMSDLRLQEKLLSEALDGADSDGISTSRARPTKGAKMEKGSVQAATPAEPAADNSDADGIGSNSDDFDSDNPFDGEFEQEHAAARMEMEEDIGEEPEAVQKKRPRMRRSEFNAADEIPDHLAVKDAKGNTAELEFPKHIMDKLPGPWTVEDEDGDSQDDDGLLQNFKPIPLPHETALSQDETCPGKRQRRGKHGILRCHKVDMDRINFIDVSGLRPFLSEDGEILSRKETNLCAKCQRQIGRTIQHSRNLGLLPHIGQFTVIDSTPRKKFDSKHHDSAVAGAPRILSKTIL